VDFSSNDYLGLSRNREIAERVQGELSNCDRIQGSTGSRLLSGNSAYASGLEEYLARYLNAEDCLLFNSGFDANVGLFSTIAGDEDVILFDEMIHASVHDGVRQSRCAHSRSFRHNSPIDLQRILEELRPKYRGTIFVAMETLYSMDGDIAPLDQFARICNQYEGVELIVDEAHATGVYGEKGRGLVHEYGLEYTVLIRVHTFGKAMGCQGACILCPPILKHYLLNYARPLIFSTFLPHYTLVGIHQSFLYLENHWEELQRDVRAKVDYFKEHIGVPVMDSSSQIQGIIVPGNDRVVQFSKELAKRGLDVRPIRSPTVPKGQERLRICIHAHNTIDELQHLIQCIHNLLGASFFVSKL
jgi:8-amino-7-oxononanoate synthase